MAAKQSPGELMKVPDFARKAGISVRKAWDVIASKEIAVSRIGVNVRISEAAYADWVRRITTDPVL